ncbi:MAG: CopG family transcriptional regulator [Terriglobales bacterium]
MRTTVRLDPELLQAVKALAVKRRTTLTGLIEESLRVALAQARQPRRPVALPISKGGKGTLPWVDLDNSAALLDLMDEPDAAR